MSASITKGSDPALSVGTRSSRIANVTDTTCTTCTDEHSPNTPRVKSSNITESRDTSLDHVRWDLRSKSSSGYVARCSRCSFVSDPYPAGTHISTLGGHECANYRRPEPPRSPRPARSSSESWAEQLRSLAAEGACSRHLHRKPCRACRGSGRR